MTNVANSSQKHLQALSQEPDSERVSNQHHIREHTLGPWGGAQEAVAAATDEQVCPACAEPLHHEFQVVREKEDLRFCSKCQLPLVLVAGKYKLQKLLGEGGYGNVYLAKHEHLQYYSQRVVKILKPEFFQHSTATKRFLHEVQVTSSVSQNICAAMPTS